MNSSISSRMDGMTMAANTSATGSTIPSSVQEYVVRVPSKIDKKFNVMKFNASLNVDFAKWTQTSVKMERENNLKDFKTDDDMPKFGAGSEYGRDAREEARKKKYGLISRRYKVEDQPWIMRLGSGKAGKRFRGIREGGVTENASYFVFTQAHDGAFEAFPVDEWYNYTPVQTYKTLNDDEAEEEFGRRDKVFNYFNIMLKKRLKNDSAADGSRGGSSLNKADGEEPKNRKWDAKNKKGHGELKISDADDWINTSDDDDDDDDEEEQETSKETNTAKDKPKQSKIKDKKKVSKKKKGSDDDDDEAWEDSDDGDEEGREVDYISDGTSSESDGGGGVTDIKKNELKGVEDEEAIRKMENSESDEDDAATADGNKIGGEENKDAPESKSQSASGQFPAASTSATKDKKEGSSSQSSADSSDSDDFDNDTSFQSAMFMQERQKGSSSKKVQRKGKTRETPSAGTSSSPPLSNRPNTPTMLIEKGAGFKRLADRESKSPLPKKKPRTDAFASSSLDGISEESIHRYLVRKPMTARELLQKFKSKKTGLSSDQMVNTITQILKRLNPDKQHVKGKMYLSIKSKYQ